jgi:hypothetical protein
MRRRAVALAFMISVLAGDEGAVVTVSRQLTRRTGCTIQMLEKTRRLWAVRNGYAPLPDWDWETAIRVGFLLDRRTFLPRAP